MATYTWTGASSTAWGTAGNWSPSGPPATSGDTAIFDQNATQAVAGSDQSATTLAALIIYDTCTKNIGDATTPLKIGATLVEIGKPKNNGTEATTSMGRVNLDLAAAATSVTAYKTATTLPDTGLEAVRLKGSHTSNTFTATAGTSYGLATNAVGDTATFATVNVSGGLVNIGSGVTLTTLTVSGNAAQVFKNSAATTLAIDAGTVSSYGDYTDTTVTLTGGTYRFGHRKTGGNSITTLNLRGGKLDATVNPSAYTVGTTNFNSGTVANFSPTQGTFSTVVLNLVDATNLTVSAS
jgi:hypothetical protein